MSLLKDYAGNPLVGFDMLDRTKVIHAVINWGKSFFQPNTLPPNASLVKGFVCLAMHDDAEIWVHGDFLNMAYFLALFKMKIAHINIAQDPYLQNIICVAENKTGIVFSELDAAQIVIETQNRHENPQPIRSENNSTAPTRSIFSLNPDTDPARKSIFYKPQ